MLVTYEKFYRERGVRLSTQILNPPISELSTIKIPKSSDVHFPRYNEDTFEVFEDEVYLDDTKLPLRVISVNEYIDFHPKSEFRDLPGNYDVLASQWWRGNPKIKVYDEGEKLPVEGYLVFSYGMLNQRYQYNKGIPVMRSFYQWFNHYKTVFETLCNHALSTSRNQFLILDLPTNLVAVNRLKSINEVNKKTIKFLAGPSEWFCLFFWKLFSGDYKFFFDLKPQSFDKINIILKYNNVATLFNLGKILEFNQAYNEKGAYDSFKFNKYMLNYFMLVKENGYLSETVDAEQDDTRDDEDVFVEENEFEDDIDNDDKDEEEDLDDIFGILDSPASSSAAADEVVDDMKKHLDHLSSFASDQDEQVKNKTDKKVSKQQEQETPVDLEEKVDDLVDDRLKALDDIDEMIEADDDEEVLLGEQLAYEEYKPPVADLTNISLVTEQMATQMTKNGLLTAGEARRAVKLANKYKELKDPRDKNKDFTQTLTVRPEDIKITGDTEVANDAIKEVVPDETMYKSSLKRFNRGYVSKLLDKHVAKTIMEVNKIGVTVQDYSVVRVRTATDDFEEHTVRVTTLAGKQSTLRFNLPVVSADGEFTMSGNKYRLRNQFSDLPIRKIAPESVALTSYYSKLFVNRSTAVAYDSSQWITRMITAKGIDGDDNDITDLRLNEVFSNEWAGLHRNYTSISMKIASFVSNGYTFYFNYDKVNDNFSKQIKDKNLIPIAENKNTGDIITMNSKTGLINVDSRVTTLEEFINLDINKKPTDYVNVQIFGKEIPLVLILGYWIGLGNLIKTLGVKVDRVSRVSGGKQSDKLYVRFQDETLVFDKKDEVACLLFGGLRRYANDIKQYSVYAFDKRDVYSNIFDNNRIDLRFLKECKTMFPMWVDHITKDILEEMGEPTDLVLLFLRACELLTTDWHPDAMDPKYMRIRGYERFSGFLYNELAKSAREYNIKPDRKDKAFTLHPEKVWYAISGDESKVPVEDSNPMSNLKQQEVVVYRGMGGRSSRSMVASARKFHKNALGTISEATVDSSNVGTIVYTSADPNFTSLYGTIEPIDPDKQRPPTKILSSSSLLAPASDIDDPKRSNFTSIQNSQTMEAVGYELLPVRTGYERIVPSRTTDIFCRTADEDGVVVDVTNEVIVVEYKSGAKGHYDIGTHYAPWSGKTVRHELVTPLKKGDKFKKEQVISYNKGYFKQDKLVPGQVSMVSQTLGRVALLEGGDTYEDSCAISSEFSRKLTGSLAKVRNVIFEDGQDVRDLVSVGDVVLPDSILCTIINDQTDTSFYDEDTIALLQKVASMAPKAKTKGVVEKIEVLYTGEIELMPPNLQEVAMESDKRLYKVNRKKGVSVSSGKIDVGYMVDKTKLGKNTTVIRIYIAIELDMETGDKLVVSNQLKGTIARVWTDNNTDEDGIPIDAYFSGQSIDNRIVDSPFLIGSTSSILTKLTDMVVDKYFN